MSVRNTALVVVDMQNDFVSPEGALYVNGSEKIIKPIHDLIESQKWEIVIFTQDWHPLDHCSFSKFPAHCIQNTNGAELISQFKFNNINHTLFKKGFFKEIDCMSAFKDQYGRPTGLDQLLKSFDTKDLVVVGVATEYCVRDTVLDAISLGYEVTVVSDLIKCIDDNCGEKVIEEMKKTGAILINESWFYSDL